MYKAWPGYERRPNYKRQSSRSGINQMRSFNQIEPSQSIGPTRFPPRSTADIFCNNIGKRDFVSPPSHKLILDATVGNGKGKKKGKRKKQGNESRFVAGSPIFLAGGMVECVGGNSRTNKRDPITIEKLTRRFANRFHDSGHGEGFKGNIVYIDIYKGSRRPEVAGQLISHFFDEDSRNSRCSLCRDTSSNNNGELLRIAATTRTHCRESYIEERKRGRVK